VIGELHERIVELAHEHGVMRGGKMRVDTTVVEINIHYPTDSSLLGDGTRALTRTMKKIIIAEVGEQASTFPSAAELTSWVGTCPGKDESAEQNHSSRSTKGNKYLRRVLNQAAHAAVKRKSSYFQVVFRRLLPRLGYQSAIWAVAHRLCRVVWKILHEGVRFIEHGIEPDPKAKMRHARRLAQALRKLGYQVTITPANLASAMQM
jgi:Transposase IS116/IS110/IS902 family